MTRLKSSESLTKDKQNINTNTTEQIKAKSIHAKRVTGPKVRKTWSVFPVFFGVILHRSM